MEGESVRGGQSFSTETSIVNVHILVVDDDATSLAIVSAMLRTMSYGGIFGWDLMHACLFLSTTLCVHVNFLIIKLILPLQPLFWTFLFNLFSLLYLTLVFLVFCTTRIFIFIFFLKKKIFQQISSLSVIFNYRNKLNENMSSFPCLAFWCNNKILIHLFPKYTTKRLKSWFSFLQWLLSFLVSLVVVLV